MSETTIQQKVAEKITGSGTTIVNTVVDALASVEINKRIELVTKAVGRQESLEKEFQKSHKPDTAEITDASGAIITPAGYTKAKRESITKDKAKLAGLNTDLITALETNTPESYKKLQETLNKLGNAGGDKGKSTEESTTES